MGRYILGDNCSSGYNSAFADMHAIRDYRPGTQPDIIFDNDAFRSNSLIYKRPIWIIKDVVYGNDLGKGRSINSITNLNPTLSSDH
jgi:hypothetical protein